MHARTRSHTHARTHIHTHTHKHTHTHTHCTVRKFWGFNILSTTQDYLKMKHVSRMCICRERMWIVPEYDGFVDETVLFIPCTVFAKLCQIWSVAKVHRLSCWIRLIPNEKPVITNSEAEHQTDVWSVIPVIYIKLTIVLLWTVVYTACQSFDTYLNEIKPNNV